jgi:hypothetical protein
MSSSSLPPAVQKLGPGFEQSWFLRSRAWVPIRKPVTLKIYVISLVAPRKYKTQPSVTFTQQNMTTYEGNRRTDPRRPVSRTGSFTLVLTGNKDGWATGPVRSLWRKQQGVPAIKPRLCRGRDLRPSEMLRTICKFFIADVSEEPISPILNGQVVQ